MTDRSPLVTPAWLESRLSDPMVRAIDARVRRVPKPSGPSTYASRRDDWEAEHIPGAAYLHFVEDLADPADPTPFMLAPRDQIAVALGRIGVTDQMALVVYGDASDLGAHRVWWALTTTGHPDVRVLDGGLDRWKAEGRATESGQTAFNAVDYGALGPRGSVADRAMVKTAITDPKTCLINALSAEMHRGDGDQVFGRRGRIPGSLNIPTTRLIDPETGCFRSADELRALFDQEIPPEATRLIPYCGGGVAATTLALALTIAGRPDIAVYDASLMGWAEDPAAPFEVG